MPWTQHFSPKIVWNSVITHPLCSPGNVLGGKFLYWSTQLLHFRTVLTQTAHFSPSLRRKYSTLTAFWELYLAVCIFGNIWLWNTMSWLKNVIPLTSWHISTMWNRWRGKQKTTSGTTKCVIKIMNLNLSQKDIYFEGVTRLWWVIQKTGARRSTRRQYR